jgi:hypothetical protein
MALELFDLDAVAAALENDELRAKLRRAIRQAVSMSSVRNDLERAREMMDALKSMQAEAVRNADEGRPIGRPAGATIQALFMQAMSLYVRATHTGGKGRNKLHLVKRLDPAARTAHDRLVRLRDTYLAHYDDPADWESVRAVLGLDIDAAKMALSYPHSRYYARADDSADFDHLLTVAQRLGDEAYTVASTRLNAFVNDLFDNRPEFLETLRANPFDRAGFFDPDEVAAYVAGVGAQDPDSPTDPRLVRPPAAGANGARGDSQ